MPKIICVFSKEDDAVADAIKKISGVEVVSREYGWDSLLAWAETKEASPDIILGSEFAEISAVDYKGDKDAALLAAAKKIRLIRPEIRLVLIFSGLKKDSWLLPSLVALGVYDVHPVDEYTTNDLEKWIARPNTLADVKEYLPKVDMKGNADVPRQKKESPKLVEEKETEKPKRKFVLRSVPIGYFKIRRHEIKPPLKEEEQPVPVDVTVVKNLERPKIVREKKMITVMSPAPTGKTFVVVNLAAALALSGKNTALVDTANTGAIKIWLNIEGNLKSGVHPNIDNLVLYEKENIDEIIGIDADYIVVDTSSVINEEFKRELIKESERIILVGDPDLAHAMLVKGEAVPVEKTVFVLNKYDAENMMLEPEELYKGITANLKIEYYKEMYNSIITGIPVAVGDRRLRAKLLQAINV